MSKLLTLFNTLRSGGTKSQPPCKFATKLSTTITTPKAVSAMHRNVTRANAPLPAGYDLRQRLCFDYIKPRCAGCPRHPTSAAVRLDNRVVKKPRASASLRSNSYSNAPHGWTLLAEVEKVHLVEYATSTARAAEYNPVCSG